MVEIKISAGRPYSVYVGRGLLEKSGELASDPGRDRAVAVVTDENVAPLYLEIVENSFSAAGFRVFRYIIKPGEASKSMSGLSRLLEALAGRELGRGDMIAALGGGVTGDLAGFAASVYQRGIEYIQLPTSLLAAVDSSVGGKTAVNLDAGKNLAGSFWQPAMVICDAGCLGTLPREELSSGAAECIKYGMLFDDKLLSSFADKGLDAPWERVIEACVRFKAGIVALDEREQGKRALLNLGHTLGHAAEKLSGYGIRHGEGVAMGMAVITRAAEGMGICRPGTLDTLIKALEACKLPTSCPYPPEELTQAALSDKKRRGGTITLILPKKAGECILYPVDTGRLLDIVRLGTGD